MYMLNFESDWLRQQTTRLGASPVRFTKIGQKKIGKTLPGLMSRRFCYDI